MTKKALILDLDNTLYAVSSIGDKLFASLFQLLETSELPASQIPEIKEAVMREPFLVIAKRYQFDEALYQKSLEILKALTYNDTIPVFPDYHALKQLPLERFLVTTGFINLQSSKIRNMGIEKDFKEIHIVDPLTTDQTKKTVFADILKRYGYATSDVLVIGDDLESEIKAATELNIDTVLYDKHNRYATYSADNKITNFKQLKDFL